MRRLFIIFFICSLLTPHALAQSDSTPLVRIQLEKEFAAPGEAISMQITVLVPTWLPSAPEFPEFDNPNLIVRLPPDSTWSVSEKVNGETWNGITREYQLYPMIAKRFKIPKKQLTVTYADAETRKPITVKLQTQEIRFEGRIPQEAKGLQPFIAAENLTLEQAIDGNPLKLKPGDAVKRTVTARLTGAAAIFLPALVPSLSSDKISSYPSEPKVSDSVEKGVVIGERIEQITYVAMLDGDLELRPIELSWWNTKTNNIETVTLDGVQLQVNGSIVNSVQNMKLQDFVLWGIALVILAIVIAVAFLRYRADIRSFYIGQRDLFYQSEKYAYLQAKRQLQKHNYSDALRAIRVWQSKLDYGILETSKLTDAMTELGKVLYGNDQQEPLASLWSNAQKSLYLERKEIKKRVKLRRADVIFPPINPL